MTKTGETTQVRASAATEAGSVRERPILFSSSMVRAILDGKKTQTRRICKDSHVLSLLESGAPVKRPFGGPYGAPGDRLWVRETWFPDPPIDGSWPGDISWQDERRIDGVPEHYRKPKHCIFAASWDGVDLRWRPGIHMPRWASRLTLEVTGVRVERLQDISGRDVLAEGVDNGKSNPAQGERWENMQRIAFETLWDSINGDRAPWASNPWLWVVSFRRVEAP